MIKSEELKNQNGCLAKAADDEPLFVLRANDEFAPSQVRRWAACYAYGKRAGQGGVLTLAQQAKYDEAIALALQMEAWKAARS